ncbi:MAG TPA: oxidoreductase [Clostridiales bacterium]|nr:oxidoreductase [Clostridiales bacterium]
MSKSILITGASKGFGFELAKRMLEDGNKVFCAARSLEKMQALKDLGATVIYLDANDPKSVEECAKQVLQEGGVDILVNNAGFGLYGPVETVPPEAAREQMEVNLFAPARLAQLLLPDMRKRGEGRIINISSVAGRVYSPMSAWYCASKFSLEGLSDCLRVELKPFNIKVVLIEPGPAKTDWPAGAKSSLLKYSQGTAYENFGEKSLKLLNTATDGALASEPEEVVEKIIKAIYAKNPKARYLCGKMTRLSVLSKSLLGNRLFDKVMLSQLK